MENCQLGGLMTILHHRFTSQVLQQSFVFFYPHTDGECFCRASPNIRYSRKKLYINGTQTEWRAEASIKVDKTSILLNYKVYFTLKMVKRKREWNAFHAGDEMCRSKGEG